MARISQSHLNDVKRYLDSQLERISGLKRLVVEAGYKWEDFPPERKANVFAIDGSRMVKRLSGAIIYAVSSVAVGEDILQWHEIGLVSPYKHVDERIRLHMEMLENRMGALTFELKNADLILMDGTLSGSIARPPAYLESATRHFYEEDKIGTVNLVKGFLELLDSEWDKWKRALDEEGVINYSTVMARREEVFELLKPYVVEEELVEKIESDPNYREDFIIFLEYLEYLHSIDKLLQGKVAFVAKTFYTDDIIKQVTEGKKESKHALMPDVPIIDSISKKRGYMRFRYRETRKWSLPEVIKKAAGNKYLQRVMFLFPEEGNPVQSIQPAYVRFIDNGVIYLLEAIELDDELLSAILSVSEDEYIIPLEYAHHTVVIKKQEFDTYVDAILNALIGEDKRYLAFLRYGREPLE
ncbi:5'-3' exonuclease [Thermococcus sp. MV5]|uniref:DNA double-strand break repair nuclease NurA n=1 Tax=Thermococcus sp. MV5 TaxID=1638272 RepID=UPI00143B2B61|nr:DNA double-strand break repair nuclease NurA [Thermococcus sp. MV5]NJE25976.1 5'-3' exonuclease [Thermococcus sp. MV5]